LSLPAPADYSGRESHLIGYAHMLDILVLGITSLECLQLFSLHGLVYVASSDSNISITWIRNDIMLVK